MKKPLGIIELISIISVSTLFAGGAKESSSVEIIKASDYKMVLMLPGPINDQSWNSTNYSGLAACNEELGTNIEYIENVQASDYESTFQNYAERGYDLILAAGTPI